MIRQLLVTAVLVFGLVGCGVGADEDLSLVLQTLEEEPASSQEPIPPPLSEPESEPVVVVVQTAADGATTIVAVSSSAPASPGSEVASSQDPIPPKYMPADLSRPATDPTLTTEAWGGSR